MNMPRTCRTVIQCPRTRWHDVLLAPLVRCALASLLAACSGPSGIWDVPEVNRQIIKPWLVCGDCTHGEFARVLATGPRLTPYLAAALNDGPTHADDSLSRARAVEAVTRANRYRLRHVGPVAVLSTADSLRSVNGQHDDFRLTYRLRAAQALVRIDSLRATAGVTRFCTSGSRELTRQPQFRASFATIGPC